jgi:hypothetical protein
VEQFKEGWYQFFFKGLVEFSRESIRSWTFLFGETQKEKFLKKRKKLA